MWHWILDAVGALLIWSTAHYIGWNYGWKCGYRDYWNEETKAKQRAQADVNEQ
jgi:hypothetical protein